MSILEPPSIFLILYYELLACDKRHKPTTFTAMIRRLKNGLYCLPFLLATMALPAQDQQTGRISEDQAVDLKAYLEAEALLVQGEYADAIQLYKPLHVKDRINAAIAYNMARAYASMESFADAETYISRAMKADPANKWYKVFHANLMRDLDRHADALASYEWLAQTDPSNRYFVENYAYSLLKLDRANDALQQLEAYQATNGVTEAMSKKVFDIYTAQGDEDKAAATLRQLADAYPLDATYRQNLAAYYHQIGKYEQAVAAYREVLAIDATNADARLKISQLDVSDRNETNTDQLTAVLADPAVLIDEKIMALLPMLEAVVMQSPKAEPAALSTHLQSLAEQHPQDARVKAMQGDLAFHTVDYDQAIPFYEAAIAADDRIFAVWDNLMLAQWRKQDWAALEQRSYDALDYFPNQVEAYVFHGMALAGAGKKAEAKSYLSEAKMVSGGNPAMQALVAAGEVFVMAKSGDKAAASTKLSALATASNPLALEVAGRAAASLGDDAAAQKYYEEARKAGGDAYLSQSMSKEDRFMRNMKN